MFPGMGGGMDPRQMSMMMKKFGIDVRDIDGVQEVVVRTATKDYVFDRASVSVMKAQGVETWQVSGKPRTVEKGAGSAPAPSATHPSAPPADTVLPISDEDVALVMKETGASREKAKATLIECKGDLAEAIVKLAP